MLEHAKAERDNMHPYYEGKKEKCQVHMMGTGLKEIIVQQAAQIAELRELLHNAETAQDYWRQEYDRAVKEVRDHDTV